MTDPAAPPATPPASGTPPAAPPGTPPASPPAATRPEWLPESFFDQGTGIKPEFGQHYAEVAGFHKTETERQAALKARKPEDIKFEIKLPDTVKLPEGVKVEIDEKDPRVPLVRELAIQHGWDQDTVNALATLDARMKVEAHTAEIERVKAEDVKLGANAKDRIAAITNWIGSFPNLKPEHRAEIDVLTATAAGVELVEMLIAKSNGTVAGLGGTPPAPPKPADVPMEQRWYPPQKAS